MPSFVKFIVLRLILWTVAWLIFWAVLAFTHSNLLGNVVPLFEGYALAVGLDIGFFCWRSKRVLKE